MDSFMVVGNGGREAIFAKKLAKDSIVHACMPKANHTIVKCVEETGGEYRMTDATDPQSVLECAENAQPDYVFVNADDPLANGVVDMLLEHGFRAIGPSREAARIEWDKEYALDMVKQLFPAMTPEYHSVGSMQEAREAMEQFGGAEVVIKPQGLTGGKGVKVMGYHLADYQECLVYIRELLESRNGESVIVSEKLQGREFTVMGITDGGSMYMSPASYDYPFRFEGDTGQGTGGMGSVTQADGLLPFLTGEDMERCREAMQGVIDEMGRRGLAFNGVLNGGFFKTENGIRFMEFNCRFGDPEVLNVLEVMEEPLSSVLKDIYHTRLAGVGFAPRASVAKYVVAREYPQPSPKAIKFTVDEARLRDMGIETYSASCTSMGENRYRTLRTSRVMGFSATGDSVRDAAHAVNRAIDECLEGKLEYRRDIGLDIF